MFFPKTEDVVMLKEAGFEPCWVGDIADGDTIMIAHSTTRWDSLLEMTVTNLQQYPRGKDDALLKWIGQTTNGPVHCTYGSGYECWKLRGEA